MIDHRLSHLVRDIELWRALAPAMSLDDRRPVDVVSVDAETAAGVRERLATEGYFALPDLLRGDELTRTREAVRVLEAHGWPPIFVFVFEEPWRLFASLRALLGPVLGDDCRALAGLWAWNIAPRSSARGWHPHRDRHTISIREARTDLLTLWLALTDATPDNGCIHVVPASRDPSYAERLTDVSVPDASAVLALPAKAGTVLGWTHHLLHWGGRSSDGAAGPRVSISMEFQRGDVPLVGETIGERIPPFAERLRLIGLQIRRHEHMEPAAAGLRALAALLAAPL